MAPPVGAAARVAGGVSDGAQAFKTASDAATMSRAVGKFDDFSDIAKRADPTGVGRDVTGGGEALTKRLNNMPEQEFNKLMDNTSGVTWNPKKPENIKNLANGLENVEDSNKLAKIGEKMNPETLDNIKSINPKLAKRLEGGADLAKKVKPSTGVIASAGKAAAYFSTKFKKLVKQASESIKKARSTAQNPPTGFKNVQDGGEALSRTDGSVEEVSESIAKSHAANSGDMGEAVADTTKVLKEGGESSKSLKKGLAELGITPGSVAIGAGVIVLLCMAYDTDNPFTAVDRALDDAGKVVKGFKEVADSAATAAKDVTTGGFDFISFVTNNSWISSACSILCVILLFALFMMGMLGSMGGGNNKGR